MNGSWVRRLFDQPPAGYLPGVLLSRALKELRGLAEVEAETPGAVSLTLRGGLHCEVRERVERHFLMHIVALEFTVRVPASAVPGATVEVRHTGAFKRTGFACAVSARHRTALGSLQGLIGADRDLAAALLGLDFRRCRLRTGADGWEVLVEPFGASEVVNRMPAFRRYLRLGNDHAEALVRTLEGFFRVLSPGVAV